MIFTNPIAHRALHNGKTAIENSARAFQLAIEKNYAIECDLQKCKDGIVVFHDNNVERLTKWTGKVIDYTIEELAGMQLLPTKDCINDLTYHLFQVQAKVPLLLEIKTADENKKNYIKQLAKLLQNYNGEVALMSFDVEIMSHCKQFIKNRLCGLVADTKKTAPIIEIMKNYQLDFLAYDINQLPNEASTEMKKIGKPVLAWTIQNKQQAKHARTHAQQIIFEGFTPK